jgi:hypothetical protein
MKGGPSESAPFADRNRASCGWHWKLQSTAPDLNVADLTYRLSSGSHRAGGFQLNRIVMGGASAMTFATRKRWPSCDGSYRESGGN